MCGSNQHSCRSKQAFVLLLVNHLCIHLACIHLDLDICLSVAMFMSTDTHINTITLTYVCLSVQMPNSMSTYHYVSQVLSTCAVASAHCLCITGDLLTVYMQLLSCAPSADNFWLADGRIFFFSFCMFMDM